MILEIEKLDSVLKNSTYQQQELDDRFKNKNYKKNT